MAGIEEHRSARDPAKVVSDYYFRLEHLLLVVDTYFILLLCVLFCFVFLFDFLFSFSVLEENGLIEMGYTHGDHKYYLE